jgi:hypothetical protein
MLNALMISGGAVGTTDSGGVVCSVDVVNSNN